MNGWTIVAFVLGCLLGRFIAAWGKRADGITWTAKTPWEWHWDFALVPTQINYGLDPDQKKEVWIWLRGYYTRLYSKCSKNYGAWQYYEKALTPVVDPAPRSSVFDQ